MTIGLEVASDIACGLYPALMDGFTPVESVRVFDGSGGLCALLFLALAGGAICTVALFSLVCQIDRNWVALVRVIETLAQQLGHARTARESPLVGEAAAEQAKPSRGSMAPERGSSDPSATQPPAQRGIQRFSVILSSRVLPVIHDYVCEFLGTVGEENEAGGVFVGQMAEEQGVRVFRISGFIPAGPHAKATPGSILFDEEWQSQRLAALRIAHPDKDAVGIVHRQPGAMDTCSSWDKAADRQAVQKYSPQGLVFAIITINNPRHDERAIEHKNFRMDFYVMAEATQYQYLKVAPTLEDTELVEAPESLLAYCAHGGRHVSAFYDFAVLRHLQAKVAGCCLAQDENEATLWTITMREADVPLKILCRGDGSLHAFFEGLDGRLEKFQGEWEKPEVGRHVWLSQILLAALSKQLIEN